MFSESVEKYLLLSWVILCSVGRFCKLFKKPSKLCIFSCWKASEAKQGFPSKTRTKQGIWYLWETLRKVYSSTGVFTFSLKEHFMFNSPIFLNCFHLVLSVLFPSVSGCWPGFSWVQRHSFYYSFFTQPFAVKTKLWQKNKQSNPYLNIWWFGLSITLAGKYLMNIHFQFFFWKHSGLNSGLGHGNVSRKWLNWSQSTQRKSKLH